MFNRYVSLAARLCLVALACLAVGATAFAQPSGYLFQLPGASVPASRFFGFIYDANSLSPAVDKSGPQSATQVLAKPDGTKFYFISAGGVQSTDQNFGTFQSLNGLTGTTTAAALTPDGKYLLVGSSGLNVIDTSNDTVLANTANITGTVTGIAISKDSKTAWVLSTSAFADQIIAVNLTNRSRIGQPYSLQYGGSTSIVLSPLGLLYVAGGNIIYEIDPSTLTLTQGGSLQLSGNVTPGNIHFSPDGSTLFFVNTTPASGGHSIYKIIVATHAVQNWPPFTGNPPPVFSDCYVVDNSRLFAFAPGAPGNPGTLWDITASPLGGQVSVLSTIVPVQNVLAVAVSSEVPEARYLYLLIANGQQTNIDRIDLNSNTVSLTASDILNSGIFQFVPIPPQSGASNFVTFNNTQTVQPGTFPLPLVAIVTDSAGRRLFNQAATFSTTSTGVTIATPTQVSNADGYVQTAVTLPTTPGTYTITLTVGGATTNYTLTIPGAPGGGGGPGALQQMTIVQGDGQLVRINSSTIAGTHLTVQVVDTSGKPLNGETVNFSIDASGDSYPYGSIYLGSLNGQLIGSVGPSSTTTDEKGIAFADFSSFGPPQGGLAFETITITASTNDNIAPVQFHLTVYNVDTTNGRGDPEYDVVTPPNASTLTAAEGQALPKAISTMVSSTFEPQSGQPIGFVGIRLTNLSDPTLPAPAVCQGDPLSDPQTGIVTCTPVAACVTDSLPHTYPIGVLIGESRTIETLAFTIITGQAATLNITQGNNQSGRAGDSLSQTLYATVSDPCGHQTAGVTGTWSVVSGSATLTSTTSVSDSIGRFSTRVVLGQAPGPIDVRLTVPGVGSVDFTLTNSVVVSVLALVSGSGQTGFVSAAFPQPVVFQVRDAQGNPIPGVLVSFNLVSGSGSVNPATATTDSQGHAATTITAGATAGSITISATAGGITTNASVTSQPPGIPLSAASFVNAASFSPGLVPCGLASASAAGLATSISGVLPGSSGFGPLPYTLGGLSMTINGIPVPLYALSNSNNVQQVTFQTPCETPVGSATVVISINGGVTTVAGVPVLQAQPGIFTYAGPNGKLYGAVIRGLDGTYVTPSSLARRGETYYVVATGLGQVSPATSTNAAGTGAQTVAAPVVVGINNAGVPTNPAQYVQGSIGVYIVGFQIPQSATTGTDQPLALAIVLNGQNIFGNQAVFIPGVQ